MTGNAKQRRKHRRDLARLGATYESTHAAASLLSMVVGHAIALRMIEALSRGWNVSACEDETSIVVRIYDPNATKGTDER